MFSNQISARELFNTNQSTQERNYQNEFSQLQNAQFTQFEMSQANSQDFFSQDQFSSGSNPESQGRRVPVVEKYMSKPSLFRSNSQNRISASGRPNIPQNSAGNWKPNMQTTNLQQQLSLQKAKAKERDERDMLSSIVCIVRECSDEVKQSLSCMRSTGQDNEEVLKSSMKSLTESLEESTNKILKAMKDREDFSKQISVLQREIRQKDEKIVELLQSRKQGETSTNTNLLESVKAFFIQQQQLTEQKIQRIVDSTQEQLKLTKELENSHRMGVEESKKHFMDVKYTNNRQVQDIEKRLIDELATIRDDFEIQKRDIENFFKNQFASAHQKHLRDIEQHVMNGMTQGQRQTSEKYEEILKEKHAELKDLTKAQYRDLEKYIKTHTSDQTKKVIKQTQDMYSKQNKDFFKNINQKLDELKTDQQQLIDDSKTCVDTIKQSLSSENLRPWQNDSVPKVIQDKLNELHNYHQSEIKRLETEMENERKQKAEKEAKERNSHDHIHLTGFQNVYDIGENDNDSNLENQRGTQSTSGPLFKNGPGFLSPRPLQGTTWNSRTLFGRTNPSPVATVLPQRKQDTVVSARSAQQAAEAVQSVDAVVQNCGIGSISGQTGIQNGRKTVRFDVDSDTLGAPDIIVDDGIQTNVAAKQQKRKPTAKRGRPKKKAKCNNVNSTNNGSNPLQAIIEKSNITGDQNDMTAKQQDTMIPKKQVIGKRSSNARNKNSPIKPSVFEFHDELSPGPVLRQHHTQMFVSRKNEPQYRRSCKQTIASDSELSASSAESSPCLSVADIFITRKVRADKISPKKNVTNVSREFTGDMCDFLSTPNLTELFSEKQEHVLQSNTKSPQIVRPMQRISEKRKLCNFDSLDVKKVHRLYSYGKTKC